MSGSIRRMNELTDEIKYLKAKIEAVKQILANKANSTKPQVDEEGCLYQHPIGLTKTEQAVLDALQRETR